MGPRAGMDGCKKGRPTGIRSPDRPACSEPLYRVRYPGPQPNKTAVLPSYPSRQNGEKKKNPCTCRLLCNYLSATLTTFRIRPDWPWRPGHGVDRKPSSSTAVTEGVELYLFSPTGPSYLAGCFMSVKLGRSHWKRNVR